MIHTLKGFVIVNKAKVDVFLELSCFLNDPMDFGLLWTVKRLPAMQETWVRSLGWEDALEKEMATTSSILAWEIPQTEETGRLQSVGLQRV